MRIKSGRKETGNIRLYPEKYINFYSGVLPISISCAVVGTFATFSATLPLARTKKGGAHHGGAHHGGAK